MTMQDKTQNRQSQENASRNGKPDKAGNCTGKAKFLMFLVALPVSFVAGIAAHFLGIAIGFLGYWLCRFLLAMLDTSGTWDGMPFCWLVVIVILVGYPFLVGMLNHKLIEFLGKKADCGKPKTVAWAGLLNGIPLYFGHVLMSFLLVNQMTILTFTQSQIEPVFEVLAEMVGDGGPMTYVLCGLEFIILLLGSYFALRRELCCCFMADSTRSGMVIGMEINLRN